MSVNKPKYDPNLRQAMDEIRAICKRRNIAAHVLLASDKFYEFGLLYDIPSWSAISFENVAGNNIGIRIRSKSSISGDREKLDATVGMICSFQDMMANGFSAMDDIIKMLRKSLTILHLNRVGTEPDSVPGDGL